MAYTLISMIGTGMYKTEENFEGYKETDYFFNNEKHFKTRLFMQAVLECNDKPINQIILLGTNTSSWDCLIDKDNDEREETISLWDSLFDQCESKEKGIRPLGISEENRGKLEAYLSERFGIQVLIRLHTDKIDDNTAKELFECYAEVTEIANKDNDILFDITHGFRSMPVLLYQSLQYSLSLSNDRDVEIIYGELDLIDKAKGYARSLSSYWNYSELSSALKIFENKLDGFKLADLIAKDWEKVSKTIKRFSEIVQTNFALQIFDVARQMKNALASYPQNAPSWLNKVKEVLESICTFVDEKNKAKSLYRYSEFLYAHKLNVQAIITLQIAVEVSIVSKYGEEKNLGDYDWWQNTGRSKLNGIKDDNWKELGNPLTNLEAFRNQIAHGGGQNRDGGYPNANNIPNIYKSGQRGVETLLKYLDL